MYEKDGEKYFVVDGHVHYWDGSPENQKNIHGKQFIDCFYGYHSALSPEEYLWPEDKFQKYSQEDMMHDLFEIGYVDVAIFQNTYLEDFYINGFNTTEQNAVLKDKHPDKFVLNTAEWYGESKGWSLKDEWAKRYLEKCEELGVKNIHVHKGPTITPLNMDAFDVADIDDAASLFPNLNFIVEHVGLPRLEDFCWIAVQEANVYAGLAVAMPFIYSRPRYFAQIIGELLYWLDEDRILFASDYAIWQPKWLVEMFVDFQIPEDMQSEYGTLTPEVKRKILGLNAANLYDLDVPSEVPQPEAVAAGAEDDYPEAPVR
ncbi:MAG: amidohydrolase [Actinobacteria bacterium]|nr:amidohydrolase [Actinomycetota bacterium]